LPTLYIVQSLLFLLLLAVIVFQGTEVIEVRHLLMRGALFLTAAIFALATSALGLARGGAAGRLRRPYAVVSFLFLLAMMAVQLTRAVAVYPEMRRVQRLTEWFVPRMNRLAWWEGIRGPMHDFEYLVTTLLVLLLLALGLAIALRRASRAQG
jgi:hypothetical protein